MATKNSKKKVGIFTTNENNLFVLYPTNATSSTDCKHELHVESEMYLGPNETSTSNDLRLGLSIPITRDWYEIAIKIIEQYQKNLEEELSEIGRKQISIKTNPQ